MKDFFSHYQIGCWHYRTTSYELKYDPIDAMKDLGMTYATLPEHWHYGKTGLEEANLDKYIESCRRNNLPALYSDRRFWGTRPIAKPSLEKAKERLKFAMDNYRDVIKGIFIADEPWWGRQDEHKAIDACKQYVDLVRENEPDLWTFIALLGVHDRYNKGYEELRDYVDTVHPDFLLYNVYSQCLAEDFEKEQGIINFYYQLYVYTQMAKEKNIPLWASLLVASCWSFREPTQQELRWQLNVCAAHGVTGFVWYHLQEGCENPGQRHVAPIDGFDNKTWMYDALKHENHAFMKTIASKLEGFKLQEVYHYMIRYSNFKAFEFADDEYIEDFRSQYHRHLIVSRFADENGRQRVMVTNGSQDKNGHFSIKFKGEYAKYNVGAESGYLAPGSAKIIDLFDSPPNPRDIVLD